MPSDKGTILVDFFVSLPFVGRFHDEFREFFTIWSIDFLFFNDRPCSQTPIFCEFFRGKLQNLIHCVYVFRMVHENFTIMRPFR